MKKNFKYAMMMATALVLGFSSCSSDDNDLVEGGGSQVVEGRATQATFTIKAPKELTYSTSSVDQAATTEETAVKTVHAYIYNDKSGVLEDSKGFKLKESGDTEGIVPDGADWKVGTMNTTTGAKKIFLIVNKPDKIKENDVNTVDKLTNLAQNLTVAELSIDSKFVMSSEIRNSVFNKLEDDGSIPTSNKLTVQVKRMVAKLTVKNKSASIPSKEIEGGKLIGDLQFAVGQVNDYSYLAQKRVDQLDLTTQVIDPNYDNSASSWVVGTGLNVEDPTVYATVNAFDKPNDEVTCVYATENTAVENKKGDLTYVAIKGEFSPEKFMEKTGTGTGAAAWELINNTNYGTSTTENFYKIKTADGNLFFKTEALAKEYAEEILNIGKEFDQAISDAQAIIDDPSADQTDKNQATTDRDDAIDGKTNAIAERVVEYKNSICYYTVYPNKDNEYDVLRNDFYNISINKIMGLGDHKPGPLTPDDKEDIIGINTTIDVTVTIQPWQMYTEDVDLKPQA